MSVSSPEQTRWLSQIEAAEYLGVTDRTVRNYISRGDLPGHRVKGSRLVRIRRADLDALLRPIPTAGGGGRV
ncbi:excisionase family DNA binding protein [Nocardioides salarius]|uniref:Excisionase family DNA binding protein n=1 Tax=Nocardioides salarius TaxID=374513 RepID=A0ABS2M5U2_9ACTN|nr:excisionase family DNA binding protein [Nocardioides salarius]